MYLQYPIPLHGCSTLTDRFIYNNFEKVLIARLSIRLFDSIRLTNGL